MDLFIVITNSLGMDRWNTGSLNSHLDFNLTNGLWESIKYLARGLLTRLLLMLLFFGCFSGLFLL